MKYIHILALVLCFFVACKKESISADTLNKGLEYYPVNVGKYIVYSYDSVIYDNKGINKYNFSGFIKEEIAEKITETDLETKYKLIKYWKKKIEENWVLTDVETLTSTDDKVIKTEENLPFIKLVFPNNNSVFWNGNALFDENIEVKIYGEPLAIYQGWRYKVENKESTAIFNNETYNVLDVIQVDNSRDTKPSIFNRRYSKEVFAKGIGLVKKEMKIYDTQNPDPNKPWEEYAQKGYSLTQQMIDHN